MGNLISNASTLHDLIGKEIRIVYYDASFVNIDTDIIDVLPSLHILTADNASHYICTPTHAFEVNDTPIHLKYELVFTVKECIYTKNTVITPGMCWGHNSETRHEYTLLGDDGNEYKISDPCYHTWF